MTCSNLSLVSFGQRLRVEHKLNNNSLKVCDLEFGARVVLEIDLWVLIPRLHLLKYNGFSYMVLGLRKSVRIIP